MISPGFWSDEKLGTCTRDERLLFMGLISNADDEGRLPGHPAMVKSMVFPYDDDIDAKTVDKWLRTLASKGLIKMYKVNDQHFIWIKNFLKHQTIQRPTPSILPSPDEGEDVLAEEDKAVETAGGKEGNKAAGTAEEKEDKGEEKAPATPEYTDMERKILAELKAVEGYPFDFAKDLDYIRDLAVQFPTLDLLAEAKKWRTYKRDKPLSQKSNPRLQFRNWCEKAFQWQQKKEVRRNGEPSQHSGADPEQEIDYSKFFYKYKHKDA